MKTTFLAAMSSILMASAVSNYAEAHQVHSAHRPHMQEFIAISPNSAALTLLPNGLPVRSPTDGGTVTGGPSGGPNQS